MPTATHPQIMTSIAAADADRRVAALKEGEGTRLVAATKNLKTPIALVAAITAAAACWL